MKEMIYEEQIKKPEILLQDEYQGYKYLVVSMGTHPCCYVEIPKTDAIYKDNSLIEEIDCHGGITFNGQRNFDKKMKYYIGWDYAHIGDYLGCYEYISKTVRISLGEKDHKYTIFELKNGCIEVINQLTNLNQKLKK